MISTHRKGLISVAIIVYLSYIFIAGMPVPWWKMITASFPGGQAISDPSVFPWIRYNAFSRLRFWHTELVAEGRTFGNILKEVHVTGGERGGPRIGWTMYALVLENDEFAQTLCSWELNAFNSAARSPSEQLEELSFFEAFWHIPSNTSLPPVRKHFITKCIDSL